MLTRLLLSTRFEEHEKLLCIDHPKLPTFLQTAQSPPGCSVMRCFCRVLPKQSRNQMKTSGLGHRTVDARQRDQPTGIPKVFGFQYKMPAGHQHSIKLGEGRAKAVSEGYNSRPHVIERRLLRHRFPEYRFNFTREERQARERQRHGLGSNLSHLERRPM
jgi:hypothetical protein